MAGEIDRLDVALKMARDEEENVGIAGVASRFDDEVMGNFSPVDIGQPSLPSPSGRQVQVFWV